MLRVKRVEIFCGTGGVGKTTLATSRALSLTHQGHHVLLITIDPARRLKQVLNISDDQAGAVATISTNTFAAELNDTPFQRDSFDALLMSPFATFGAIGKKVDKDEKWKDNIILKILTRPYGGMNEIMSIVEVQRQLQLNKYDTIILDTPPGKHFIDFLESSRKINKFFDKSFIEIFKYLGKSDAEKAKPGLLKSIVTSGVKKLLSYLEKVTGAQFVETFIDAVHLIYQNKDGFLDALTFAEGLKSEDFSNWFLVTSVEQMKAKEAADLRDQAQGFMHNDNFLAINKCLTPHLVNWEPNQIPDLLELRNSMIEREAILKDFASKNFANILSFTEVMASSPQDHVRILAAQWPQTNMKGTL